MRRSSILCALCLTAVAVGVWGTAALARPVQADRLDAPPTRSHHPSTAHTRAKAQKTLRNSARKHRRTHRAKKRPPTKSLAATSNVFAAPALPSAGTSAQSAGTSTNLALGRPAVTSSVDTSTRPASNAVDGNLSTRWSSAYSNQQWIYVDLGSTYNVTEVVLNWETAYGKAYKIQVSNDAATWQTIYSTTTGTGGVNDLTGLAGVGRYVRMYGTARGTQWGYSLWEFSVYGTPASSTQPTAPSGLSATAGSTTASLSWNASTDSGNAIAGYRVYRNGSQVGQTTGTAFTDSGLSSATTYTYYVVAYDGAGNVSSPSNTVSATTVGAAKVYWGAHVNPAPPFDWTPMSNFETNAAGGKQVSSAPWGQYFYSTNWCGSGGYCMFWPSDFDAVRSHGALSFFSWSTQKTDGSAIATDAQIAAGAQDSYITQWAQGAKAWGHPFFLRFDWEMNGRWFPWGVGANGNTASDYVAMWRHVHDIFTNVGATNVSWVWCPNIDPGNTLAPLASLYPGDAYVDWTCLDAYNGVSANFNGIWDSFATLVSPSYNATTGTIAPTKPMFIGEVASPYSGGNQDKWVTDMLKAIPTSFPAIHGFNWWEEASGGPGGYSDWPIESSSTTEAAFALGISSSTYVPNTVGSLGAGPIPPPN